MGLHISSMNGLKGQGYELFVLTYGLDPGSPEFRTIQSNFSYLADLLDTKGLVITGSYDREFGNNFTGFLEKVESRLFSASMIARESDQSRDFPVPSVVVIQKSSYDNVDIAYFSIRGSTSETIVGLFRQILEASKIQKITMIEGNLLRGRTEIANSFWEAIQLRPSFFGIGLDVKELIKRFWPVRSSIT